MKRMTTLLGALVLALWFGAGQAAADGGSSASQTAGQAAPSGQTADGMGTAYQSGASNNAGSRLVFIARWTTAAQLSDRSSATCWC